MSSLLKDRARQWEDEVDWPAWVPYGTFGVVLVLAAATSAQRIENGRGIVPVLYMLLAITPWLLGALDVVLPFRTALPFPLFPIPVLVGTALLVSNPTQGDFAPFLLVFLTGEVASRAQDWRFSLAVAGAGMGLMAAVDYVDIFNGSFIWWIGIAFGWFGGFLVQNLFRRTLELKQAQAGLAEKAAADERARVAREVHDVIAHSMSVTMLHITAARMALEREQSSAALESLREAETQGRNSLNDIRRTVGLLGPEGDETAHGPMPTATDLPKLVGDFQTAGLDVTLDIRGDVNAIPPAAGLNLYRIAQESLTNAAKYAPGAQTRVELDVTGNEIELSVRNGSGNGLRPAHGSGNSLGLRGMTERAQLLGGTLDARREGDGWVVRLTAPLPTTR